MNRVTVLVADLVAVFAFATFARLAHRGDGLALSLEGVLSTYWPFAIGVVVAFIVLVAAKWDGAKVRPAGVTAWVVTVVIGLIIWGVRNSAFPHWSFILVASIMSALLMLGWRAVAGAVVKRR